MGNTYKMETSLSCLNIFSEDDVTTESGNEFQMCITLIEKKFERKL